MNTPPAITPCPFCGDTDPGIDEIELKVWAVVCNDCGCTGPVENYDAAEQSAERAIELWNRRPSGDGGFAAPAWVEQYGIKV